MSEATGHAEVPFFVWLRGAVHPKVNNFIDAVGFFGSSDDTQHVPKHYAANIASILLFVWIVWSLASFGASKTFSASNEQYHRVAMWYQEHPGIRELVDHLGPGLSVSNYEEIAEAQSEIAHAEKALGTYQQLGETALRRAMNSATMNEPDDLLRDYVLPEHLRGKVRGLLNAQGELDKLRKAQAALAEGKADAPAAPAKRDLQSPATVAELAEVMAWYDIVTLSSVDGLGKQEGEITATRQKIEEVLANGTLSYGNYVAVRDVMAEELPKFATWRVNSVKKWRTTKVEVTDIAENPVVLEMKVALGALQQQVDSLSAEPQHQRTERVADEG